MKKFTVFRAVLDADDEAREHSGCVPVAQRELLWRTAMRDLTHGTMHAALGQAATGTPLIAPSTDAVELPQPLTIPGIAATSAAQTTTGDLPTPLTAPMGDRTG